MDNYIPPDNDQDAVEYQINQEQWWEEQDAAYQAEEEYVLEKMTLQDTLEAVEVAPKALHDEMWDAMRNEDIVHMKEALWQMYRNYASMKAHQNVDRRVR